jgi:DNA polymerase-3 subunit gamma/tau
MSLYLKYRPRSFADVVGQEHVVTTLEHAIERDQLVHAYLFFGPRGIGKTSVARILAKILLIRGIPDETLQKQILRSADEGTLVDLIEVDAATNRQIDDVRELREKVQFSPSIASAKVYIIDEVHMMTKEAFNALLKTLEEPPSHAYFILATTEPHKVPETIHSRCQRFPFHWIGDEDILRALQNIADQERIKVTRGALRAIARHAKGGLRDAITLLDQLSSLEEITEEEVRLRIGESADEEVEQLWKALDTGDRAVVLTIASSLEERGVSLEVFLRQLLTRARQHLHANLADGTEVQRALQRIDAVFQALRSLRVSPVPSVAIEAALVEMCGLPVVEGKAGRRERVKEQARVEEKVLATPRPLLDGEARLPVREGGHAGEGERGTFLAKELTREAVLDVWKEVLAAVQPASVRMSLKDASIEEVTGNCLTLGFSSNFHREKVEDPKASMVIERLLQGHFHQPVRLVCLLRGGESSSLAPQSEVVNVAEAAAEIFK